MRDVRSLACADSVMDRDLQASAAIKEDIQNVVPTAARLDKQQSHRNHC